MASLMEAAWSCYRGGHFNGIENGRYRGGHFNGGRMMLQRWCLIEGEWSCCRGGQYNGGRMVMFSEVVSLMEGEWLC